MFRYAGKNISKKTVLRGDIKMVEINYFVSPYLSVGPTPAVLPLGYMKATLLMVPKG